MRRVAVLPLMERPEQVIEVMSAVEAFTKRAKQIKQALELAMIEYLDEHGEIEWQGKRWYVGTETEYELAVSMEQAVDLLLTVTGGDQETFCSLLSAGALKPGECKKVMGERFGELFHTKKKPDLATGKPRRVVKHVPV